MLIEGDCRDLLHRVPDCSVAMAFLDPPYNLQLHPERARKVRPNTYRRGQVANWDEFESVEAYDEALTPVLEHLLRVLQPDGSLWVSGSYHCIHRLASHLQDFGAWFFTEIVWWRPDAPPPSPFHRRPQMVETILWVAKNRAGASLVRKRYSHELMVQFATEGFKRKQPLSIWSIPVTRSPERLRNSDGSAVHPTQKPLELVRRMVRLSTLPGELVLDPMAGTGTTGEVAMELGRRFLLFEREPEYVTAAGQRLSTSEAAGRAEGVASVNRV
ncbi:MAG: DNA-methyltransferase [Armatimonadota bacterium]